MITLNKDVDRIASFAYSCTSFKPHGASSMTTAAAALAPRYMTIFGRESMEIYRSEMHRGFKCKYEDGCLSLLLWCYVMHIF